MMLLRCMTSVALKYLWWTRQRVQTPYCHRWMTVTSLKWYQRERNVTRKKRKMHPGDQMTVIIASRGGQGRAVFMGRARKCLHPDPRRNRAAMLPLDLAGEEGRQWMGQKCPALELMEGEGPLYRNGKPLIASQLVVPKCHPILCSLRLN